MEQKRARKRWLKLSQERKERDGRDGKGGEILVDTAGHPVLSQHDTITVQTTTCSGDIPKFLTCDIGPLWTEGVQMNSAEAIKLIVAR